DPRDVEAAQELLAVPPDGVAVAHDPGEPHPALLARRVWSYSVCEQRREFLRAMHWWPQRGAAVVVIGHDADFDAIESLTTQLHNRDVTVIGQGQGDAAFSAELAARLGPRAHYMPATRSSMEDRIAACAGAAAVVSSDPAALALADAYGR